MMRGILLKPSIRFRGRSLDLAECHKARMMYASIGLGWKYSRFLPLTQEGARRRAHSAAKYPEQNIRVDEIAAVAAT